MKTLIKKPFKILRGIIVGFLCMALIVTLLLTVFSYTARVTLLNPDFVKDRLSTEQYGTSEDQNVYQLAEGTLIEASVEAFEEEAAEAGWESALFTDTVTEVLEDAGISIWLQEQVENILEERDAATDEIENGIFPYMKSEIDNLELTIDLTFFKQDLADALEEKIWNEFYRLLAEGSIPPELQFNTDLLDEAIAAVHDTLDEEIEDEVDITPGASELNDLDPLRQGITLFNNLFLYLCLLSTLLILTISLLLLFPLTDIKGKVRKVLRTLALPFLISGIICLIVGFICGSIIPQNIPAEDLVDSIEERITDDNSVGGFTDLIGDVINDETLEDFFSHLFSPISTSGTILLVIAVIMIITWFILLFVKGSSNKKKDEPSNPKDHEDEQQETNSQEPPEETKEVTASQTEEVSPEETSGESPTTEELPEDIEEGSEDPNDDSLDILFSESSEEEPE